jgi:hypothetical protein
MDGSGFLTHGFSAEMVDFQSTMKSKRAKKKGPPSPAAPSNEHLRRGRSANPY